MGRKKKVKDDVNEEVKSEESSKVTRARRKSSTQNYKSLVDADSSSEEEDPNVCPICDDRNDPSQPNDKKNRMIGCDGCDKWYHWTCVGINQTNKPGKTDDWFCKKCGSKKTEAGEWRPDDDEADKLDVLPLRDQPQPEFKTLAQKKSYEGLSEQAAKQVKKGRPSGSGAKPKSNEIFSGQKRRGSRESWITNGSADPASKLNQLPSSISFSSVTTSDETSHNSQDRLSRLPPGISLSRSADDCNNDCNEPTSSAPSLPPGITLNRTMEQSSSSSSNLPRLPPGISINKETDEENLHDETRKEDDISFLTDVSQEGEVDKEVTSDNNDSVLQSPRIKLIKVNDNSNAESVDKPEASNKRSTRDKREQTARIRATFGEDEISDDELFGGKKVVYKKKKVQSKQEELTPVDELLADDPNESKEEEEKVNDLPKATKKRGRPSKKSLDSELLNAFREVNGLRSRKPEVQKDSSSQSPEIPDSQVCHKDRLI